MAKKNSNATNRGGFFTSGPQDGKELPKRNPYPTVSETAKQRYSHGYMQSQIVGLQGDGVNRNDPRLNPDIHVLPTKVAHAEPEPGPGTAAQREHIRRMRENKQIT
jgi:hypothetical protein